MTMNRSLAAAACGLLLVAGCLRLDRPGDRESDVRLKMQAADSLAAADSLHSAALAFEAIAEEYPFSPLYPDAVLRAAVLSSHPNNAEPDDSTALLWLDHYVMLPVTVEEKQRAEMEIALLTRLQASEDSMAGRQDELDSLRILARAQSSELQNRLTRIHELEAQVKQTNDELARLRDVDIKISRRAAKK